VAPHGRIGVRWVFTLGLGLAPLAGAPLFAAAQELEDEGQKLGYSIGYQVGGDFRRQGLSLDSELVVGGVLDALQGSEPRMPRDEMRQTVAELKQQAAVAEKRQLEERALSNLAEGRAFLAENGKREGVTTLPTGLQYEVLAEGEAGESPTAADTVTVHYRGTLIDGTEFDSSHRRGEPSTLALDGVIRGWAEGLQLMRPGAKYRLFVPPELAYGERGAGPRIGPNSTLVFEVELLSIQSPE
jgi:FKBP-type peptidyl-prolyl cis-trans isomerase FklB